MEHRLHHWQTLTDALDSFLPGLGARTRHEAALHWSLSIELNSPRLLLPPVLQAHASALVLRQAAVNRRGALVQRGAVAIYRTWFGEMYREESATLRADDFIKGDGLRLMIPGEADSATAALHHISWDTLPGPEGRWTLLEWPSNSEVAAPELDVDLVPLPRLWAPIVNRWCDALAARLSGESMAIVDYRGEAGPADAPWRQPLYEVLWTNAYISLTAAWHGAIKEFSESLPSFASEMAVGPNRPTLARYNHRLGAVSPCEWSRDDLSFMQPQQRAL